MDCRPGKFHRQDEMLGLLRPGGLYVVDDLLPQPTWPAGHEDRVAAFLAGVPGVEWLRSTTLAWASGLVVAVRV